MIRLELHTSKDKLPDCDYLYDKTEKLKDLIDILTPKFSGNWEIVLLDPKLSFIVNLLEDITLPKWIDFTVLVGKTKLEKIVINYPAYAPRKKTSKEVVSEAVSNINNLIEESAKKILRQVYGTNEKELIETLQKLDKECESGIITLKQVKGMINYEKRIYASDVLNAFLVKDRRRWNMYEVLLKELGMSYAYNAIYSYVRKLLQDKSEYLLNRDSKYKIVEKVDAPLICYVYQLFVNSNNYKQLTALMFSIDNRCASSVERIKNVNF